MATIDTFKRKMLISPQSPLFLFVSGRNVGRSVRMWKMFVKIWKKWRGKSGGDMTLRDLI